MQSLFSLQQCKEADHELSLDYIKEHFKPDLNSMEPRDKALLKDLGAEALRLFEKEFESGAQSVSHENDEIQNVVNDALARYYQQVEKDASFLMKTMVRETAAIYNYYLAVLALAAAFGEVATTDKKVNHKNFVTNAWIHALMTSAELKQAVARANAGWDTRNDRVKQWFRDVVRQDAEYMAYLDKKEPRPDEQKKFTNHLLKRIILGKTVINEFFEEEVLRWTEDKEIVKALLEKTVKGFTPGDNSTFKLFELSVSWEEDVDFMERLFSETHHLPERYKELIANNTRNWEVDRLPLTDRVILEMAIGELKTFPNIPVKVTINEYIELTKHYSTPNSRQFVNGILDVITKALTQAGDLKKSGRGLIDNK